MEDSNSSCTAESQTHRYSREIDAIAPKPGRDLGTITFCKNGQSTMLRVIEGATRDAMSFRGLSTDFATSKILNFHLRGNWVDLFEDLPYSPYDQDATIEYLDFEVLSKPEGGNSEPGIPLSFNLNSAKAIYSRIASERGQDPDAALLQLNTSQSGTSPFCAHLTGIKRGWCPIATVAIVGIVAATVGFIANKHQTIVFTGKVKAGDYECEVQINAGSGPATASIEQSGS